MPNVHTMAPNLVSPAGKNSDQNHGKATSAGELGKQPKLFCGFARELPVAPANASSLDSLVFEGLPGPPERVGEFPFQWSLVRGCHGRSQLKTV